MRHLVRHLWNVWHKPVDDLLPLCGLGQALGVVSLEAPPTSLHTGSELISIL